MRVLCLSPLVPGTAGSGFQTRVFHLLSRLVDRGHVVTVVCPIPWDQENRVAVTEAAGIAVRGPRRPPSRPAETLSALLQRPGLALRIVALPWISWQLEVLWTAMAPFAAAELATSPDVVIVEWDTAATWHAHLPPDLPAVITMHDASWAYAERRADLASGLRAVGLRAEAARVRRFARRRLPAFDRVVAVSRNDAARARALSPALDPVVIDNGVDIAGIAPLAPPGAGIPLSVVFTGTLDYEPNADGAVWMTDVVWPHVLAEIPEARLRIVGRNPGPAVLRCGDAPGVEVHADVPDMTPYFADAHLAVVPLRSGGGTRLKILEAAAAGRPVVSTSVGAEGLDLGEAITLADSPKVFAAATVALLRDAPRREALADVGRAAVEARYGWHRLGDALGAELEALNR